MNKGLLLLVLISALSSCTNLVETRQMQRADRIQFTFGVEKADAVAPMVQAFTKRLQEAGYKFAAVEPGDTPSEINVSVPNLYDREKTLELLTNGGALALKNVYRGSDSEILSAMQAADSLLLPYQPPANLYAPEYALLIAKPELKSSIDKLLSDPTIRGYFPADASFYWYNPAYGEEEQHYLLLIDNRDALTGQFISEAKAAPDMATGEMVVMITMNDATAKKWEKMTTEAANNGNREIAIILNDSVVSVPRVISAIQGGKTTISGDFTHLEAKNLAASLIAGPLPAKPVFLKEEIIPHGN